MQVSIGESVIAVLIDRLEVTFLSHVVVVVVIVGDVVVVRIDGDVDGERR